MCGRFTQTHSNFEIANTFNLSDLPQIKPRYNIAPSQEVATIIASDLNNSRQFQWLRWGLIPHWSARESIGHKLINARAETVREKPAFKTAFQHHRCLIIADGFYEWQPLPSQDRDRRQTKTTKQPFHIRRINFQLWAFAGLWSTWTNSQGTNLYTCTILTTTANKTLMPIHKRMPLILNPQDYDLWLDRNLTNSNLLTSILNSSYSHPLHADPVTTLVNNPRNDSPDCLSRSD